jgi:hypothetical protein
MCADETDAGLTARLDRIRKLIDELARVQGESGAARELAERIKREVDSSARLSSRPDRSRRSPEA